jgi:putative protease
LNLSDHLAALLEAGVTSFKIEGRLKDVAYVRNITAFYRQKLDALIDGRQYTPASSGKALYHFIPDPGKTFNRGFTTYNLTGTTNGIGSPLTPKSMGEEIGPVVAALSDHFTLSDPRDLAPGDGICFFTPDRILLGTQVHRVDGQNIYPDNPTHITAGTLMYRNHARAFIRQLERNAGERRIGVSFTLFEAPEGFAITALDENSCSASFLLAYEKKPAQKQEQARAAIRGQLSKLGNTVFSCGTIHVQLNETYFIPVSILNQLRRGVVERLMAVRLATFPRWQPVPRVPNNAPYPEKNLTFMGNVLNQKAAAFYRRHGVECIEPAAEAGLDMTGRMVMTTKYCLKNELGLCGKKSGQTGPWFLKDAEGHVLELRTDCPRRGMYVYLRK